jgi:glucose/arabinose dehydrogenase
MRSYLHYGLAAVLLFSSFILSARVHAQSISLPEGFEWRVINDDLTGDALGFATLPDGRILVINKSGTIDLIVNGVKSESPVMTLSGLDTGGEKGLLGIALDPDFPLNPFVYLFYSTTGNNHVSRYTVLGDVLDPDSFDLTISPVLKLALISDMPYLRV